MGFYLTDHKIFNYLAKSSKDFNSIISLMSKIENNSIDPEECTKSSKKRKTQILPQIEIHGSQKQKRK